MPERIIAHTPFGDSGNCDFLFKKLTGMESISALYEFKAEFLSRDNALDMNALLGKEITLEIALADGGRRYLHGHITRVEFSGYAIKREKYKLYTLRLHPTLWYLTQNRDCRIWQEKSIPEILTATLAEFAIDVENRLSGQYRCHPYSVQYQESTFNFLSRLMEHEGIYYFFRHHAAGHTLVLADSPQSHRVFPGYEEINYRQPGLGLADHQEGILSWSMSHEITPGLFSTDDYDFQQPRARLAECRQNRASFAANTAAVFDWPGRYADSRQGQFLTQVRQQGFEARHQRVTGLSTARGLAPGSVFNLRHCPRPIPAPDYLVIAADYLLRDDRYDRDDLRIEGEQPEFSLRFEVAPAGVPWRPALITPWPKTHGPQTAEVTGPAGKPIWTDKYGRVKVKFRWDRRGRDDETSSCWLRVSSAWAGWRYGSVQVPRVGEEVLVDFINGDPDRPIVTGRVYNQDAMPPWELPAAAARMGFMSRGSGGGAGNASYLFMEDAPGRERFVLHAERDMAVSAENNHSLAVDGNLAQEVKGATSSIHHGPSVTLKYKPDCQTYHLGKCSLITAGGRADLVVGGEYSQVTGNYAQAVSGNLCQRSGKNQGHYAGGDLMLDAGNRIIFGASLPEDKRVADAGNLARQALATLAGAGATAPAGGKGARPTRILYQHGAVTDIQGDVREEVSGACAVKIAGDAREEISGDCRREVRQEYSLRADGDLKLDSGGEMQMTAKKVVLNVEGHIETHSGNALNITGSAESIDSFSFSMSKMAIKNYEMLTTSTKLNLTKTDMRLESVDINIGRGQLDIRSTLLSLHVSAMTIFI